MHRFFHVISGLLAGLVLGLPHPGLAAAVEPPWDGVNFTNEMGRGGYGTAASDSSLAYLRRMGANTVALVPYGYMRDRREANVHLAGSRGREDDSSLVHAIRTAHSLGLRVMLKPQVWVVPDIFTGDLAFEGVAWGQWLEAYTLLLDHYREMAAAEHVEALCLGTEFGGLTRAHEADWRGLIRRVRAGYPGMLTYSANWWGEFEELDFWADLDYIGVSCYYPLEGSRREELAQSALRVRNRVGAVAKRYGKKVLLLEVGYPSRAGAALEPFKETDQGTPDAGHQADCCAALLAAFEPQPWFGGMLWWKWYNTLEALPPDDLSYMPHGKPAEEVLREYFRRAALGR